MKAPENIFSACATRVSNPDDAITGALAVRQFSLVFESEGFQLEFPFKDLDIDTHPLDSQKIVFKHPGFDDWEVYTYSWEILDHYNLTQRNSLWPQIKALKSTQDGGEEHNRTVFKAIGALVVVFLVLWASNNHLLRWVVSQAPASWEEDLGREIMAEVRQEWEFVTDPILTNQLHLVADRLLASLPKEEKRKFVFHLADAPQINAFAIPGGHIVVLTGLLQAVQSPEELAGVLAHEMAHLSERHTFRQAAEAAGPAIIARYFMGNKDAFLGALAATSTMASSRRFSREHEMEADERGWDFLLRAKINPRGMISFFQKLESMEVGRNARGFSFLSTHPPTSERIQALQKKHKSLWVGQTFLPLPVVQKPIQ